MDAIVRAVVSVAVLAAVFLSAVHAFLSPLHAKLDRILAQQERLLAAAADLPQQAPAAP